MGEDPRMGSGLAGRQLNPLKWKNDIVCGPGNSLATHWYTVWSLKPGSMPDTGLVLKTPQQQVPFVCKAGDVWKREMLKQLRL